MHRWCLLNLTVQGFSLNLTVRGVSNKHCLLTFFILLAWRFPNLNKTKINLYNVSSQGNNRINLTYCDETKKSALNS